MRKLLILGVILGILVLGDAWARATAEKRVEMELRSSFRGAERVDVQLGGFPFVVRALAGSIPAAEIRSTSFVRRNVAFSGARLTMQDLRFSWSELLAGDTDALSVRDGRGRTQIDADALTLALHELGANVELDLSDGRVLASLGPVEAEAGVAIRGMELELRIPQVDRTFAIPLPRFAEGVTFDSVRIGGEVVIIEFSLRDATFSGI